MRKNRPIQESVTLVDVGAEPGAAPRAGDVLSADDRVGLCVGSPVYRDLAVSPIMDLLDQLPEVPHKAWALPFVTWGEACSGIALWQMGRTLHRKGYALAGALKIQAVHSMMWRSERPLGAGRPNREDLLLVRSFVDRLVRRLKSDRSEPLPLDALDYQPPGRRDEMTAKMESPPPPFEKRIDKEKCTLCGLCQSSCPARTISLEPEPTIGPRCIDCMTCYRLCPEEAVQASVDFTALEAFIRNRAASIGEEPPSQAFEPR
ncbi:4Fe-4S binding domain-containing protein [Desulfacinum infernum DSM 9756]|jgi:ferredoxin|uniref:4Fe-4S binding domain-containing protein n=1 Tax=Desulfacinum infernum DSM 9756 TaxID=1121391 RepID=A0A1M5F818_9BACT|nr:4Fe-4S binding protein [Desulfacinum infernum]SHF87694.1 4Fe-4S binding domain-containing protein [Desulfacinum infernum DSM 9756]